LSEPAQETVQVCASGVVLAEKRAIARDLVAPHVALRADRDRDGPLQRSAHVEGMSHPTGALERGRRAAQRGCPDGDDDLDRDAEPDLNSALEREGRPRAHRSNAPALTGRAPPGPCARGCPA